MKISGSTDTGQMKPVNEDSFEIASLGENKKVIAVADGMGGHSAGNIASEQAIETFITSVEDQGDTIGCSGLEAAVEDAANHLEKLATDDTNVPKLDEDKNISDMGTTFVAAEINQERANVINIGDSRCYDITNNGLRQITEDHSFVQKLIDEGEITESEAKTHPRRNVITQSLNTDGDIDPDTYESNINKGILLCSDGLTEEVSEEIIYKIICRNETLDTRVESLIEKANENGGSDNITVIISEHE